MPLFKKDFLTNAIQTVVAAGGSDAREAKIVLHDLDQSVPSFEARIFVGNSAADATTPSAASAGSKPDSTLRDAMIVATGAGSSARDGDVGSQVAPSASARPKTAPAPRTILPLAALRSSIMLARPVYGARRHRGNFSGRPPKGEHRAPGDSFPRPSGIVFAASGAGDSLRGSKTGPVSSPAVSSETDSIPPPRLAAFRQEIPGLAQLWETSHEIVVGSGGIGQLGQLSHGSTSGVGRTRRAHKG